MTSNAQHTRRERIVQEVERNPRRCDSAPTRYRRSAEIVGVAQLAAQFFENLPVAVLALSAERIADVL
jgi:hypothetical protein